MALINTGRVVQAPFPVLAAVEVVAVVGAARQHLLPPPRPVQPRRPHPAVMASVYQASHAVPVARTVGRVQAMEEAVPPVVATARVGQGNPVAIVREIAVPASGAVPVGGHREV